MKYDIIVIGAGSGGLGTSLFMNKAGFKVLLIDKTDRNIGGDCLNFGCVPSKALIHTARLIKNAQDAKQFGLKTSGQVNLKKIVKYVQSKKEVIREHENATYLKSLGIDVVLGTAKFSSKKSVMVNGQEYSGKKIVIATGSRPRELTAPGIEKVKYHTNETIFDVQTLPKKMVVIGGGPIGMELGQCFLRFGCDVTIVIRGNSFLPKEDPEIADVLQKQLENEGIRFLFNTNVKEFPTSHKVVLETAGTEQTCSFDLLLVSIGRVLNIANLAVEKAGIEKDERGNLKVDPYLRTTNKNILVVGDAAGSYQFTHAAELHVRLILHNFFSLFKEKLNNNHLSWVTYTSPEIATFGLNEEMLKQRNIKYQTLKHNFQEDDRAIVAEATYGLMKLYVDQQGHLLGGSMIAENAGELFQELVLANTHNLTTKHLFKKIYPYPTASRINQQIIQKSFEGKLTPLVKKMFRFLYH